MVFGGEVSRVGRSVRVLAGSSVGLIQRLMIYFEYECRQSAEFQTGAYRTTEKKVLGFFPGCYSCCWGCQEAHAAWLPVFCAGACPLPLFVHNLWHFIVAHLLMSLLKKLKKRKWEIVCSCCEIPCIS